MQPDALTFKDLCRVDLASIFEADQRDRRRAFEARRLARTSDLARQADSPHVAHSRRQEEQDPLERPSKRHSSFSQNSSRSNLAPLTILPSSDFPNAPSSPASQVFASPESSPTFSDPLANSTHSLPNVPREPWRRTSSSHSFAGHLQHRGSASSADGLARPFTSSQLSHYSQFTAQNRNHSFSSSDSSVFAEPPFASLQRVSTAPQPLTNYQGQQFGHSSPNFSPNFSPHLSHSFSQEIPSPFALPHSASPYPAHPSSSSISSLYSQARRPSTTRPINLRRQSAVNASGIFSFTRPARPSDTLEELANQVVDRYENFDPTGDWGAQVRKTLDALLLECANSAGSHNIVSEYLQRLSQTEELPIPGEVVRIESSFLFHSFSELELER